MPDTELGFRLRLDSLEHEVGLDGRCIMTVRLVDRHGSRHEVRSVGLETQQGRLLATAQATLDAARKATSEKVRFSMVGVKGVRAFDGWVIITRVNATDPAGTHRLLGAASAETEEATLRATAKAVLDATNRLLQRILRQEPTES